ncbi:MAG: 23S rRNA (uracil(1939)-C(5))-methyltransferase RlmD [Tissierellia bacterium]|nr:23S rRNA (uracil(1939)-C(5))-methyltransferase RlmD [Tissierellia bacterium]
MTKQNKYMEVKITGAEYPNISTAQSQEDVIKFKGGLIGQTVAVKGRKAKDGVIHAKLQAILEDSPLESLPGCPRVDECGGCRYQKLDYNQELNYKLETLRLLYQDLPFDKYDLFINPAPNPHAYRNKMEYTFGDEIKDGPLTLGLHKKNRFYEIIDNFSCNIVNPDFDIIRQEAMFFFDARGLKAYHKIRQTGALKFLIVRYSFYKNEFMINLVTKEDQEIGQDLLDEFVGHMLAIGISGKITSIFHTISNSTADAVKPEKISKLYGEDYITEKLLDLEFRISPFSFFQPNPQGAQNLFSKALEYAGSIDDKIVYDLYCGTGTISQIFAKKAKKVIGIEIVEEAVKKARENAFLNQLANCEFIVGDVLEEISKLDKSPDLLVLDPPREGIHPKAIDKIIGLNSDRVVYISCNPKTQVRDLKNFIEAGYKIEKLEFFDQFPRTASVESVALLTRGQTIRGD